jgi:TusA-related sulfurtransferase
MEMTFDKELDARGMNCPMPVVMARKEIMALEAGQILKITATDRGSIKDFQGWAKVAKDMELLDQQTVDENGTHLYIHYVKKGA